MDLEFYDGNRIYDPAVKRIVEEIDYNAKESVTEDVKDNLHISQGTRELIREG